MFKIDQDVGSSVQTIRFNKEILGRFMKIELAGYSEPCLKIEIIGCPVRGKNVIDTKLVEFNVISKQLIANKSYFIFFPAAGCGKVLKQKQQKTKNKNKNRQTNI